MTSMKIKPLSTVTIDNNLNMIGMDATDIAIIENNDIFGLLTTTLPQQLHTNNGGGGHNDSDKYLESTDVITNEYVQVFFCILYSTVFVLGVLGNVLVCYVVLRNRAMQTVTNIFITNLALSDILLCILAVPFTPLYTFMGRWAFGKTLCHLVPYAQGCSIYISTLTLTSIAIDRYLVIIYPFHPRMKLSTCVSIIVSIWIVSLLATLPYGMYVRVSYPTDDNTNVTTSIMTNISFTMVNVLISKNVTIMPTIETQNQNAITTYCEENWPSEHYRKVFGSVTTILQFVLPFFIISICYIWVSIKLNARAKAKPGSKSSRREEADRDRKKRTNRMLISMVGVFGLSWLPINVVNIFDDFYEKSNEWRFYTLLFFVAHSIAMSSTCYNPFLYAWLNENFRKEFKHVLPCFNPSTNNIINITITRGYNRCERNTCGSRLHNDIENDDNQIQTDDSFIKKVVIIPREATYGSSIEIGIGSKNRGRNVQKNVDILLNDDPIRNDMDSSNEQTIEMGFSETPFMSSDNTANSNFDTTASNTTTTTTTNANININ